MDWVKKNLRILREPVVTTLLNFVATKMPSQSSQEATPQAFHVPLDSVWGEFHRLLRGRMKMPRGGPNGGGSMQTNFDMPMVTERMAELMFGQWPSKVGETDPCWELSTMAQCETYLAFHESVWAAAWGYANVRPIQIASSEASCVLLAAPPFTVRLRETSEGLKILAVHLAMVIYTETDSVILPPDAEEPETGQSIPFYKDPPRRPGLHRDIFRRHSKRMVGCLLKAGFTLTERLALLAPVEDQQEAAASRAAASESAGLFEVESILEERPARKRGKKSKQTMEYLVRWAGYNVEWEAGYRQEVVGRWGTLSKLGSPSRA